MRSILIDDEPNNHVLLSNMLKRHCPQVNIIAAADSVDHAYELIMQLRPELIFLDVEMPEKNGLELLRMFEEVDFSVIFVTGYDEYAIKAFEFNAVDYILKPVDHVKLIQAAERAHEKLQWNSNNLVHFVHSLEEKTNYIKNLMFHRNDKVHIVDLSDVTYIVANRGYCEIFDVNRRHFISARPLADFEELLQPIVNFLRINKSYIINTNHIDSYSKGTECIITMRGSNLQIEVSRRKKTGILQILKSC